MTENRDERAANALDNPNRSLTGKWCMRDWRHECEKKDKRDTATNDAELVQTGKRVTGHFTSQELEYEIEGSIQNELILTGTWRRKIQGVGGIWHGAFQFKVLNEADRMHGKWVGVSKNLDAINCGEWEWKRHGVEKYPTELYKKNGVRSKKLLGWLGGIFTALLVVVLSTWMTPIFGPKPKKELEISIGEVEKNSNYYAWPITIQNNSRDLDKPIICECTVPPNSSIYSQALKQPIINTIEDHKSIYWKQGGKPLMNKPRKGMRFELKPLEKGHEFVVYLQVQGEGRPSCRIVNSLVTQ